VILVFLFLVELKKKKMASSEEAEEERLLRGLASERRGGKWRPSEDAGHDKGEAEAMLEAVESSLIEYLVDLFPTLPMDILLYNVRVAQLTNKPQEHVVEQCLQFSSMDAHEQQMQLQHFREQSTYNELKHLLFVNNNLIYIVLHLQALFLVAGNHSEASNTENNNRNNSNDNNNISSNNNNGNQQLRVRSNSNRILQQPSFEDDIEEKCRKDKKGKKRKKEDKVAQAVFNLVNEFRVKCEQTPLEWDPRLSRAALAHSKNMAKKKIPAGLFRGIYSIFATHSS